MDNVIGINSHTSNDDDILQEACDWIAKLDRELSVKEEQELGQWLALSAQHTECFLEAASMMDKLDELSRLESLFPEQTTEKRTSAMWITAVAASFVLCMSVLLMTQTTPQVEDSHFTAAYQTTVGEKTTIHLPDGSTLILNTDTSVNIDYNNQLRMITLHNGELHVDVAHNRDIPLQVIVNDKVIQAVGTAFNVQFVENSVELIVTDGVVQIGQQPENTKAPLPLKADMQLTEGQQVEFPQQPSLKAQSLLFNDIDKHALTSTLSWQRGRLVFNGDKLHHVLDEISRYSGVTFNIENTPKLRNLQIAGVFQTDDVEQLLTVLRQSFKLNVEKNTNGVIQVSAG